MEITVGYTQSMRIISVEGNIGSGKSTFLTYLSRLVESSLKSPNKVVVSLEPTAEWTKPCTASGESMLGRFYRDKSKYAMVFHMHVLRTRWAQFEDVRFRSPKPERWFSERCIRSSVDVFGREMLETGCLDDVEWRVVNDYADALFWPMEPDCVVYIRSDPEVCFARMHARNRTEESGVSLEYLTQIHERYEAWIRSLQERGLPVHVVDGNRTREDIERDIDALDVDAM